LAAWYGSYGKQSEMSGKNTDGHAISVPPIANESTWSTLT